MYQRDVRLSYPASVDDNSRCPRGRKQVVPSTIKGRGAISITICTPLLLALSNNNKFHTNHDPLPIELVTHHVVDEKEGFTLSDRQATKSSFITGFEERS